MQIFPAEVKVKLDEVNGRKKTSLVQQQTSQTSPARVTKTLTTAKEVVEPNIVQDSVAAQEVVGFTDNSINTPKQDNIMTYSAIVDKAAVKCDDSDAQTVLENILIDFICHAEVLKKLDVRGNNIPLKNLALEKLRELGDLCHRMCEDWDQPVEPLEVLHYLNVIFLLVISVLSSLCCS